MGTAARLRQVGLLVAVLRLRPFALQVLKVEPDGRAAPNEAHQIRCREKNPAIKILHGALLGLRVRRIRESPLRSYESLARWRHLPPVFGVSGTGAGMPSLCHLFQSRPRRPYFILPQLG